MSTVLTGLDQVAYYVFLDSVTVNVTSTGTLTSRGNYPDRTTNNTIKWTNVTDVPGDFAFARYKYSAQLGWQRNVTLAQAKDEVKAKIRQKMLEEEVKGVSHKGKRIDTSRQNQDNIAKIYNTQLVGTIGAIYYLHTDGTHELLDTTAAASLAQCVMAHVQRVARNCFIHSTAVDALTTVNAVYAYDYSGGWTGQGITFDVTSVTWDSDQVTFDSVC